MYFIASGRVEVSTETLTLYLSEGDFFGEMSILEELPRNASARAATDVKVIMIDGATFDGMLRANPEIGPKLPGWAAPSACYWHSARSRGSRPPSAPSSRRRISKGPPVATWPQKPPIGP